MVAIAHYKRETILRAVQYMYTQVARHPEQVTHSLLGRPAIRIAGYPDALLEGIPQSAIESFAGVANFFRAEVIRAGDIVLDLGSGSGTDTLLAARFTEADGKVYALDMTEAMREKVRTSLEKTDIHNVAILTGEMEAIPLADESVDVVISNGALNMAPDKGAAIAEIFRVLKPLGRLALADIALSKEISFKYKQDPQLWAECIVGAIEEGKYLEMLRAAGFREVEAIEHIDYFSANPNPTSRQVAELFDAHALVIRAVKPASAELARLKAADAPRKRASARLAPAPSRATPTCSRSLPVSLPGTSGCCGARGARALAPRAVLACARERDARRRDVLARGGRSRARCVVVALWRGLGCSWQRACGA